MENVRIEEEPVYCPPTMEKELSVGFPLIPYGIILDRVGESLVKWGCGKIKGTVWNFIKTLIEKKHKFTMSLDKLNTIYNKIEYEMSVYSLLSIIKLFPDAGSEDVIGDPQKYAEAIMRSLELGLANASTIQANFEGYISKDGKESLCISVSDIELVAAILATVLYAYAYTDINPQSLALILYQKFQDKRVIFMPLYKPPSTTDTIVSELMEDKDPKVQGFCKQLYYEVGALLAGCTPL